MSKVGVLGAGTWGTALSRVLALNGHEVSVWSAVASKVDEFARTRKHPNLPGMEIPEGIRYTLDISEVCKDKDLIMCAIPSVFIRQTMTKARTTPKRLARAKRHQSITSPLISTGCFWNTT